METNKIESKSLVSQSEMELYQFDLAAMTQIIENARENKDVTDPEYGLEELDKTIEYLSKTKKNNRDIQILLRINKDQSPLSSKDTNMKICIDAALNIYNFANVFKIAIRGT